MSNEQLLLLLFNNPMRSHCESVACFELSMHLPWFLLISSLLVLAVQSSNNKEAATWRHCEHNLFFCKILIVHLPLSSKEMTSSYIATLEKMDLNIAAMLPLLNYY